MEGFVSNEIITDRSMPARFQRHLNKAVREFLEAETGFEPFMSMKTHGMDFHHFTQSWRYRDISLGIEVKATVVD